MINHNNRIIPHRTRKPKKCTMISGNHNLSIMASGNNSTILPIHLKIRESIRPKITKNNTVGKIANSHVRKWFFTFIFPFTKDFLFILSLLYDCLKLKFLCVYN